MSADDRAMTARGRTACLLPWLVASVAGGLAVPAAAETCWWPSEDPINDDSDPRVEWQDGSTCFDTAMALRLAPVVAARQAVSHACGRNCDIYNSCDVPPPDDCGYMQFSMFAPGVGPFRGRG
jgi:hypothetical protein